MLNIKSKKISDKLYNQAIRKLNNDNFWNKKIDHTLNQPILDMIQKQIDLGIKKEFKNLKSDEKLTIKINKNGLNKPYTIIEGSALKIDIIRIKRRFRGLK